jgi:carbapenam-3-carboxylate synthase
MGGFLASYDPADIEQRGIARRLAIGASGTQRLGPGVAAWIAPERPTGMTSLGVGLDRELLVTHGDRLIAQPPPRSGGLRSTLRGSEEVLGRWCGALCARDALVLWTDPAAACPLFFGLHPSGAPVVSTAGRAVAEVVCGRPRLRRTEGARTLWPPGGCGFEGVRAVPPGSSVELRRDGRRWTVCASLQHTRRGGPPSLIRPAAAYQLVRSELERAVDGSVARKDAVGVTISGGVDSATVAMLARSRVPRLCTYTVGTPYGDEFAASRRLADFLGSEHHELVMTAEGMGSLLPDLIWHMETWDLLTLQIAAPTAFLYKALGDADPDVILTGYGADLLFGGTLAHDLPEPVIEEAVRVQVAATVRTNELSPALAESEGVTVRYPFWAPRVVRAALSVRGRLKVRDGHVKHALRSAVEPLLPPDIAWRPKTGIHEGAGMHQLFSEVLGCDDPTHQARTLRDMARTLFEHDAAPVDAAAVPLRVTDDARSADLAP